MREGAQRGQRSPIGAVTVWLGRQAGAGEPGHRAALVLPVEGGRYSDSSSWLEPRGGINHRRAGPERALKRGLNIDRDSRALNRTRQREADLRLHPQPPPPFGSPKSSRLSFHPAGSSALFQYSMPTTLRAMAEV